VRRRLAVIDRGIVRLQSSRSGLLPAVDANLRPAPAREQGGKNQASPQRPPADRAARRQRRVAPRRTEHRLDRYVIHRPARSAHLIVIRREPKPRSQAASGERQRLKPGG
jgi:hypothetical protein